MNKEALEPPLSTQEVRASVEELRRLNDGALSERKPSFMQTVGLVSRYPKAVFFILGNEFCERFSFYGMRTILTLYLLMEHDMDETNAKVIYHLFVAVAYATPLLGSILADDFFGRFKVILYVSIVYVFGHVFMSLAAVPHWPREMRTAMDIIGLATIAFATGGIKPCVSAFAADQFPPTMCRERAQFFSFFYFAINAGGLLAVMVVPLLRDQVTCFGADGCFPLAFGVPGVLMLVALVLFVAGWRHYRIVPAERGRLLMRSIGCIYHGLRQRIRNGPMAEKQDWLEHAYPKYDKRMIDGVRCLLAILLLFAPVPMFWALFDQQGSTWVLQANKMNGRLGPLIMLPDQMAILNAGFILTLVCLMEGVVYPGLRKVDCVPTALQRMSLGGMITASSFVMAGFVQLWINATQIHPVQLGRTHVVLLNTLPCDLHMDMTDSDFALFNATIVHQGSTQMMENCATGRYTFKGDCTPDINVALTTPNVGHIVALLEGQSDAHVQTYEVLKETRGRTKLHLIVADNVANASPAPQFQIYEAGDREQEKPSIASNLTTRAVHIKPAFISDEYYKLMSDGIPLLTLHAQPGATHAVVFYKPKPKSFVSLEELGIQKLEFEMIPPNDVHMMWQVPQYFLITLGEILVSVTGLEFSYSQAPLFMKSVLQAIWLMTVFAGNMIALIVSGSKVVEEPAMEFFLYAFLMAGVMTIFIMLSMRYRYRNHDLEAIDDIDGRQVSEAVKVAAKRGSTCLQIQQTLSVNTQGNSLQLPTLSIVQPEDEKPLTKL